MAQPPHIVIFPSPGMGHLIPLATFATRLSSSFTFTFAVSSSEPPTSSQISFLSSLPSSIDHLFLPPIDLSDAPPNSQMETLMALILSRSLPALRSHIESLVSSGRRVVALLVDLFGTDAIDVARDLKIPPFIFFPSTAMALSLFLYLDRLDKSVSGQFKDLGKPVMIPGCVPVRGADLLDPLQDRNEAGYKWILYHSRRYGLAEGIILNSFEALEAGAIRALLEPEPGKPMVYPIGPLIQVGKLGSTERVGCLKWLDDQPRGSVLFVNFGSGGTLSEEQQNELARGLAKSGQRFLWVVRNPNSTADAGYFGLDGEVDPIKLLPEGFVEETSGMGFLVTKWAPQIEVLSHEATGGFLSHCGWNSTLESVVYGVPLITWPLHAEQKMNTVTLTEDLRVGIRPSAGKDGIVTSDEIARVVAELIQGEEGKRIRSRMAELKRAAAVALSEDGSSTRALKEIVKRWENNI